jgi:hypothetical protein
MEVNDLKGRIAEALVESILRRAGYRVARVGRESHVHELVKVGPADFSPDFLLWKQIPRDGAADSGLLHRLLAVEVKYRSNLREFLRTRVDSLVEKIGDQWPELYCILVTDKPEDGRSCFQVLDMRNHAAGRVPVLTDLHKLPTLNIFKTTVQEYEALVKDIFALLNAYARDDSLRSSTSHA